jgi:ketosteroid isomerase-like protein
MAAGTAEQARDAVHRHIELWNAQEREKWLALFAEDVHYEDPPGIVASHGRQVMADHAWDRSFTDTKRWILEAVLVIACGHEAVVHIRNHGSMEGRPAWTDSMEVWAVDADGLVTSVRAFWEPPTDPVVRRNLALNEWGD